MINIAFPSPSFRIRKERERDVIFDEYRKQWVLLSPEEWVRQNFISYLVKEKHYPMSLIAVEKEIKLGELKKRFDVVVYKESFPWMIIECKEMNVQLNEAVVRQILNYNIVLQVEYLVVTNGKQTFGLHVQNGAFEWIEELPSY